MNRKQRTLGSQISVEGNGLHFGHNIQLELHPAPCDHGITVQIGEQQIPLNYTSIDYENLERRTVLKSGDFHVNTTEHLLSVLHGFSIDNVQIQLYSEGNIPSSQWEFPLIDGCAKAYSDMVMKAGIVEQEAIKHYYSYPDSFHFSFNSSSFCYIPWERESLVLTTTIVHPHFLIGVQTLSLVITEDTFYNELASARTFCTLEEVEELKKRGLIKGGTLKQALVLGKDAYLNPDLNYKDEPVRHKMLDFLGDLKLLGSNLKGHIIAISGGHKSHCSFVKKLKYLEASYVERNK